MSSVLQGSPFNLNSTSVPTTTTTTTTVNSAVSRTDIFNHISISRSSDNHTATNSHSSKSELPVLPTLSTLLYRPFPGTKTAAMSTTTTTMDELKSNSNHLSKEEQQQFSPIAHKQPGSYGWKGEWNMDNMEVVIQKLRGLKTQ
ncbi:hypothetical protein K435DRAFT_864658 [Dendrothele bispora CBS 962.96]|uniref:Uncharacterized protein n=1 Tax=Dendrothele bispora (strain CBS 962.96) TaxID=1314807 RepID=A0A4S8LM02_DENBC|nr:hypothetical protein K435DRAFT_864658 [Dendrothele bispora CBS 962.96]